MVTFCNKIGSSIAFIFPCSFFNTYHYCDLCVWKRHRESEKAVSCLAAYSQLTEQLGIRPGWSQGVGTYFGSDDKGSRTIPTCYPQESQYYNAKVTAKPEYKSRHCVRCGHHNWCLNFSALASIPELNYSFFYIVHLAFILSILLWIFTCSHSPSERQNFVGQNFQF